MLGWNNDEEQGVDPRLLKKSDSGRILLEAKVIIERKIWKIIIFIEAVFEY